MNLKCTACGERIEGIWWEAKAGNKSLGERFCENCFKEKFPDAKTEETLTGDSFFLN